MIQYHTYALRSMSLAFLFFLDHVTCTTDITDRRSDRSSLVQCINFVRSDLVPGSFFFLCFFISLWNLLTPSHSTFYLIIRSIASHKPKLKPFSRTVPRSFIRGGIPLKFSLCYIQLPNFYTRQWGQHSHPTSIPFLLYKTFFLPRPRPM